MAIFQKTERGREGKLMRILALDLAQKTGWATNHPIETSGVDTFDVRRGESPGTRYLRFVAWLREKIIITEPEIIVFEKAHHRGGGCNRDRRRICDTPTKHLCGHGPRTYLNPYSYDKKHATGKGNAGKPEMMAAYKDKWGKAPIDDNECDARWILDYARQMYKQA